MSWRIELGDVFDVLPTLPSESVQCVVTSPPYWGLRDYGVAGQIGLERHHDCLGWARGTECGECYVCAMVRVFRMMRFVMKPDATAWLNLGDGYAAGGHGGGGSFMAMRGGDEAEGAWSHRKNKTGWRAAPPGLKAKDLCMIPARVALALQADGWWLRQDNVWSKPNPMPESAQDRTTRAHEFVFLLTKSARYYYNAEAIREPFAASTLRDFGSEYHGTAQKEYADAGAQNPSDVKRRIKDKQRFSLHMAETQRKDGDRWRRVDGGVAPRGDGANKRSVWTIATKPFSGAHFATFPEDIPELCIKAGTRPGDIVLDPFAGAGTTGLVAERLGRDFIGIELNPAYLEIARERIRSAAPLLTEEWLVQAAGDGPRTGGRTS